VIAEHLPTAERPTARPAAPAAYRRWHFPIAVFLLLIAAFFRTWQLGTTPPGMHAEELVNAQISDRLRDGALSVIYDEVHPAREGLYYGLLALSTTLFGRGLILWRLPSVWLSMLSLAITLRLMRRLFGIRVALMAVGLMAVAFWPVWIGRTVQHVALMPLVTSAVVYSLTRAYLAPRKTEASLWFTVGGLALGIAQYVHVTAWTLVVLLFAFLIYRFAVSREEMRQHLGNVIYALVLTLIICLPLLIFLVRHPGVREPVPVTSQPGLIAEIPERLVISLAGLVLRGDMLPWHNLPGRPVLDPVVAALAVVGIGVALARWRHPAYGLALLWLAIGLIPTAFLPQKPDFEFMAVILPIVFAFPAIGLRAILQLVRQRLRDREALAALPVGAAVGLLILGNAVWTYNDYFRRWPALGDVRLNYQADLGLLAHYLDTSDDPSPILICSQQAAREQSSFTLSNAELLAYLMHRHNLPIRYFDCTQSLVLASGGESQRLIFPRSHYYDYLPGSLLAWMQSAQDEQVPGVRPDVIMRLDVAQQLADYAGAFMTTALTAWPPETADPDLAALPVPFGYNIAFLGYEIRDTAVRAGDWVELTTYWRVDGPPPPELTLFAHMLGSPVVILAQDDRLGVATATLQVRDIFIQQSMIQTPAGMTPGEYPLSVGLYFPSTGQRLPAFEAGAAKADRLFLRSITIVP
jgi:4-amino-4-deoxy-L-arabinose transferase-like glycosyltransferase